MSAPPSLLEQIIATSELSPIFARGAITRALRRAGLVPEDVTRSSARMALPEIRRAVEPFLQGRTDAIMRKLELLLE